MKKTLAIIFAWIVSLVIAFLLGDFYDLNRYTVIPTEYGRFLSNPKVEVLDGGRKLKLIEDFIYVDPNNFPWLAPKDSEVDGASIPQIFWTATGGPFSGKYRNASIVHDVECDEMKRDYESVHLMFYHACLAGEVPEREAKRLYWAVARFGPRWHPEERTRTVVFTNKQGISEEFEVSEVVSVPFSVAPPTDEDVAWANEYFKENDPPLELIPGLGPIEEAPIEPPRPN